MKMLQNIQLDLMLALSGIGVVLAVLVLLSKALSRRRRLVIAILELSATFLLFFDRLTYFYDGDASSKGIAITRVSNFMGYLLNQFIVFAFIHYVMNIIREDQKMKVPRVLRLLCAFMFAGMLFVVAGSFTDYLYYFEEGNIYHRGPGFMLCYIVPSITILALVWYVIANHRHFSRTICISLLLFLLGPVAASFVQIFTLGFSLMNIVISIMSILAYIFAYLDINDKVDRANTIKIEHLEEQRKLSHRLFEQIANVLASAIDAKDEYTRGHSHRVAEYSEKIARQMGKSEDECKKIYYTALLHDVGKIGVPDSIITKNGKLTDEEYAAMKQHPVIGNQILSSVKDYPYLSIGARYHHERYDGRGYPDGLKGEEIPEVARIISVADAYDAMTSHRSYRSAIPQQLVREEIVKNAGTQFDPDMAKIMQYLIDIDNQYEMKERKEAKELRGDTEIVCADFADEVSEGILITAQATWIHFTYEPEEGHEDASSTMILFDSLDAHYHSEAKEVRDRMYFEYGRIRLDGTATAEGARKIEVRRPEKVSGAAADDECDADGRKTAADERLGGGKTAGGREKEYAVEAVRVKDHVQIRIDDGETVTEVIVALPDCTRYAYIGLTGKHCTINHVTIEHSEKTTDPDSISRIAEEISYIDGKEGDIPNIQIDNFRSDATVGVAIEDRLKLTFHSMSLPTARLIWHCPYILLFHSSDGTKSGANYREFGLVRLDGEYWEGSGVKNTMKAVKGDDFKGWEHWKEANRAGIDVTVTFTRNRNRITVTTENLGLNIENTTEFPEGTENVYVALTGDQCALTDIRIMKE
ncbi:MAG: HD domain-containing protein [Lachnospiraceae bacterium]|nr:HD domain-containing protein [Lachnospiraceae bacterium]